ncbi:MAG: hypothetical protein JO291_13130 [Acidimicrobiia bacterium]|nr:hypothetical protein [Acidimicrobiia bacterium]
MAVLAILTAKAGWFRRDDELAAHERAIRSLGWSPVILPVRAAATADELVGFVTLARPSVVWIRREVALPDGLALPVPVVRARPQGLDAAILDAEVRPGPREVCGDITVITASPSPRLRDAVARLREAGTTVVAYGTAWGGSGWFEPEGRAALTALASAPVHVAELGRDGALPHSVLCAAAVGAVPLLIGPEAHTRTPGDFPSVRVADAVVRTVAELLADPTRRRELAGAARAWVASQRLEPQWRTILEPYDAPR